MASNDEAEKLKEIAKIKELISKLNAQDAKYYNDILKGLDVSKNSLYDFQKITQQIGDDLDDVRNSLDFIHKSLKDSVNELQQQDIYLNLQKSSLNKLSNIARETLDIRRGEVVLEDKKFKKLQDQARINLENLELAKKQGNFQGKALEALNNQIELAKELNKQFNKISETNKDTLNKLGLAPQILGGIGKTLSKLGLPDLGLEDALNKTKMLGQEAASLGNKGFNPLATYTRLVAQNISDQFTKANLLQFVLIQIVSAFKKLDDGIGEFAKGMNLSYQDAAKLNNEFNNIANSSMDVAVTTKGIRDTMLAMGKAMGSNAILNEKDAVIFTKLREQAGLANEELVEMEKLSLATGTSLEKNVENTLYAAKTTALKNGVLLNEKQLMQEVAKASAATKLSLANNPEALAKAAAQAKALGMNLEQVNSIADKMLDIESSISNELEAELLIGKNLNLEQARLYALNNDMEGLSREIAKNFGSAADFSKMNRLQQEAAAKAVGMSREELAKTLTDQEALKGLTGKQAEDAKAALADARARGMSEEEIKKKGINGLMQQQSIQERFNQSIEKLKEIFISLLAPLMPVLDIFAAILKPVGMIAGFIGTITGGLGNMLKYLLPIYGVYQGIKIIQQSLVTQATAQYSISKLQKSEDMGINAVKLYRNKIEDEGIAKKIAYNAQLLYGLIREQGIVGIKTFANTLDDKSIAKKIIMKTYDAGSFLMEKGKAGWKLLQIGYEATLNGIKKAGLLIGKGELITSIGRAAMGAISSLSSIPIIGWALGLAAAGTAIALGYKFMKGNDIMSPGYGKRTLYGPEGAIALNDKDTVIAGTNLFGDDVISEPGKATTLKGENEIKSSSGVDMSAVIAKLDALTAAVQSFGTKPVQVAVTMDGKKVAEGLGNYATQLGTSANVGTSKVS